MVKLAANCKFTKYVEIRSRFALELLHSYNEVGEKREFVEIEGIIIQFQQTASLFRLGIINGCSNSI